MNDKIYFLFKLCMTDDECVSSKTVDKPPAKDKAKDSEVLNTEKEKKRIARQKERRATLILGELCVTTGSGYKVRDGFSFFFFFNPMDPTYTIFWNTPVYESTVIPV